MNSCIGQIHTLHVNSYIVQIHTLLVQFPIWGGAYLSLPLEWRRWQTQYHSCQNDGYFCCHCPWRSTSTCAWGVCLPCDHNETHDGCHSSCCSSKSKNGNKCKKEILNNSNFFFWTRCPCSTKKTGNCAWPCCSFS